MTREFKQENFEKEVIEGSRTRLAIVDFYATWCGPCKLQGPIIEELAEKLGEKAIVGKVNIDTEADIALKYEVMSVPTIIVFNEGEVVETLVGLNSKQSLMAVISKYIN